MLSIVIPSYNQAQYLPQAIESAINQTFPLKEIIVIDDGSTDNSLEIAKQYPVKVVSQVNKGLASARNTGIMNAVNEFCFFLDADDVLQENCLEKILEVRAKNPEIDIIAPSFKCFGMANNVITLMANPKLEDFRTGNRIGYFSAIRRKRLLEVGGYSPRMIWGYEDLHLTINLLTTGSQIVTIPEPLVLYRIKANSMIHEAQKHHQELLAQINKDFPQAQLNF